MGRGKYCSRLCSDKASIGRRNSPKTEWKKGMTPSFYKGWRYQQSRKNGNKYILLHKPHYEGSGKSGYIREHRYVMEQHLGRKLLKKEVVHHVDGNTLNNKIENLTVMDKKEHDRMNVKLNVHKRWTRLEVLPLCPQ